MTPCPCGSGKPYPACCGVLHDGVPAKTAEALMRSRYAAYALGKYAYLAETVTEDLRDGFRTADMAASARGLSWTGLEVVRTEKGGPGDTAGVVEFAARYVHDGKPGVQREVSRFVREDGRWLYAGAVAPPSNAKVGRNDPCPCGSGKKYKKCCGA